MVRKESIASGSSYEEELHALKVIDKTWRQQSADGSQSARSLQTLVAFEQLVSFHILCYIMSLSYVNFQIQSLLEHRPAGHSAHGRAGEVLRDFGLPSPPHSIHSSLASIISSTLLSSTTTTCGGSRGRDSSIHQTSQQLCWAPGTFACFSVFYVCLSVFLALYKDNG